MEKFLSLPIEKQTAIINAALEAFGANGYKKASISDIATAAGISKAMVFHYFGTKKELYMYLIDYCGNLIISEVTEKYDPGITDFFERIILTSNIEIAVIRKHPSTISFLTSVYFETNEEVKDDIKAVLSSGDDFRSKIAFDGVDTSRFKEGIDIKLVVNMLMWMTDGFMNATKGKTDFDAAYNEFYECMLIMRDNFYKEEYINKN